MARNSSCNVVQRKSIEGVSIRQSRQGSVALIINALQPMCRRFRQAMRRERRRSMVAA